MIHLEVMAAIILLQDNPAIWNAIAETSKRIFPRQQTIVVSLPLTIEFQGTITTLPILDVMKTEVKKDDVCLIEKSKIEMRYFTMNGTRIKHFSSEEELILKDHVIPKFQTSYLDDAILKKIHEICTRPILVSPIKDAHFPGLLSKKSFILLLNVEDDDASKLHWDYLNQHVLMIKYSVQSFDTGQKFLVVIIGVPGTKKMVLRILDAMSYVIFNINDVYVLTQGPNHGTMELYTWYPYDLPSGDCGKLKDVILLDTWIEAENGGKFVQNLNFSTNKIPSQITGCCFDMMDPLGRAGVEKAITKLVSEKISGDQSLCRGRIEVSSKSIIFINQPEVSARFFMIVYRFFIPVSKSYVSWSHITDVFHVSAWLFVVCSLIISAFFLKWLMACTFEQEYSMFKNIVLCALTTWSALLGVSVPTAPISTPMRIFLFSWMLYSMCIATVFQAFFNSYFVVPGRQHQVDSVQELEATNTTFLFNSLDTFTRFAMTYDLAHHSFLLDKLMAYKYFLSVPNTALFTNTIEFSHYMKKICGKERLQVYHKLTGDDMQFTDDLVTYDPLVRSRFNDFVTRIVESGISEKIMNDLWNHASDDEYFFQLEKLKDTFFPLSVLHLWSAFGVISLLYICSLLVFISELTCSSRKKN
ncbi:Ionotropic receptor 789 [Blattella germanica]|nr:Ionotropic receptor 789 [Blattella germanica]